MSPRHPGPLTLSASPRSAEIVRKTRETDIRLKLDLDGQGRAEVATGLGFLDHMLDLFARHSLVDLAVACTGDLHVDGHHTTEDVGICLGQAIDRALGDRAGIRLGYLVARAAIVAHLVKVKDSYNCDMLSQVAGIAGLRDQGYLAETRAKILATRSRLTGALRSMGYTVPDSQSNFVWATGGPPARETFQRLKDHKILVRLMSYPGYPEGLRISVGTDAEIDRFLEMLREIV